MSELESTLSVTVSDGRRTVAILLPIAIPVAMTAAFATAQAFLGDHGGYVVGFAVYWGTCAIASGAILGRDRIRDQFRDQRPRLGRPTALGAVLLLWPPLGGIATRFIPEVGAATLAMVATIAAVGAVNAILEELLWRGVFLTLWPANAWLGWVWPAIGFGAWHFAPQVIHPSALGPAAYVISATVLGLSWGWVAWRTGTLRWVTASHVLTDASGVRNALFFIGG